MILSQCNINIRGKKSRKLRLNYRTTEEIRSWAVHFLQGQRIDDLDGGEDHQRGYRSLLHGEKPILKHFPLFKEEINFIDDYIQKLLQNEESLEGICLVCRTTKALEKYKKELKKRNYAFFSISRKDVDSHERKGIRLSTMYRIKGLEFNYIIICSANKEIIPNPYPIAEDYNPLAKRRSRISRTGSILCCHDTRQKRSFSDKLWREKSFFRTEINSPCKYP